LPEGEPEGEPEKPSKKGNPRHDPIARMKEATRKEAEAKAELRQVRNQLNEALNLLQQQPQTQQPQASAKQSTDGRPQAENFDDFEQYLDARDEWNRKNWSEQLEKQQAERRQQDEGYRAFNQRMDEFKSKADFTQDPNISRDILELTPVFMLEKGAPVTAENVMGDWLIFHPNDAMAVGRYLSEHEDEFQRIAALSNGDLVYTEMAKVAGKAEAFSVKPEEVKAKGVSKAKPPVKPVSGAPYIADDGHEGPKPGEDFDSWLRRTGKIK